MPSAVRSAVEEHGISEQYPSLIEEGKNTKGQPEFILVEDDGPHELVSDDKDDEELVRGQCVYFSFICFANLSR